MEEQVTISKTYFDKLVRIEMQMTALESAGVDNWQGYGDAMEIYNELLQDAANEGEG